MTSQNDKLFLSLRLDSASQGVSQDSTKSQGPIKDFGNRFRYGLPSGKGATGDCVLLSGGRFYRSDPTGATEAMKRRIEWSVETEKITLHGPAPSITWCAECEKHSMRINSEQAALLAGVSEIVIYRMIEEKRLHHTETTDGRLRICMASLAKAAPKQAAADDLR